MTEMLFFKVYKRMQQI